MKILFNISIAILLYILSGSDVFGQEVLKSARIQAKANRRHMPSLGLPERLGGDPDRVIWYKDKIWKGADSLKALPFWRMTEISKETFGTYVYPEQVMSLFKDWLDEKPEHPLFVVWGPILDSQYIAVCKRAKGDLNWKSIGFIYPNDGMSPEKRVWDYSCSVNWIEWILGYNMFPKLPDNLQEIVEEMTVYEHLCLFVEFDTMEIEGPDWEIDYDWLDDQHEIQ